MPEDLEYMWPIAVLGAVAAIPIVGSIISLCTSAVQKPRGPGVGSRKTVQMTIGEDMRRVLKELDPIDSLYFDVSVARHMIESGRYDEALEWLDGSHALRELEKSLEAKFITPSEYDRIKEVILKASDSIKAGRAAEALSAIMPLQEELAEKAYMSFKKLTNPGGDPPQVIDAKFEPLREAKRREWEAMGASPGVIEKALEWAESYTIGMASKITKDPALRYKIEQELYPKALDMATAWVRGLTEFLRT